MTPPNKPIKRTVIKTSDIVKRYGKKKVVQKQLKKPARSRKSLLPKSYPDINKRCKAIREALGLTQKELADEMGVTRSMVASVENTVVPPNIYYMISLNRLSGKSIDYIILGRRSDTEN